MQKKSSDGFVTSLNNLQEENVITVYPNPFEAQLQIDLPSGKRYAISIYDFAGQLVHQQAIGSKEILRLPSLSAGLYMLKVKGDDIIKNFKIQKKWT